MPMSNYYVSPGSGNDTTGNGTIGTPWATVQKALNTITRNATDGDTINVQAGTADTLTAELSLTAYGTPTPAAPLIFRGYTATANDGGIGEIDGAGSVAIYDAGNNANKSYIHFWGMKLGNTGASRVIRMQAYSSLVNCELHTSAATQAVYFHNVSIRVVGCLFHSLSGTNNVSMASSTVFFIGCTFRSSAGTNILHLTGSAGVVANCHFDISDDTSLTAIYSTSDVFVMNCTIYSNVAQTVPAILVEPSTGLALTLNNLVVGYNGVGGVGYSARGYLTAAAGNGFYNTTTAQAVTSKASYELQAPVTLSVPPLIDPANDDFGLTVDSAARGAAWPRVARGMPVTVNAADIGATQAGGGSGGGGPVVGSRIIRGLGAV